MDQDTVLKRLRALVAHHGTQKAAAAAMGISAPYLADVLKGKRDPGPKVIAGLGLHVEKVYRP